MGVQEEAQGVQVTPLNPLPVFPCLVLRELRPEVAVVLLEVAGGRGRGAGGADGLLRVDRVPQVRGRAGGERRAERISKARRGPELEGEGAT